MSRGFEHVRRSVVSSVQRFARVVEGGVRCRAHYATCDIPVLEVVGLLFLLFSHLGRACADRCLLNYMIPIHLFSLSVRRCCLNL